MRRKNAVLDRNHIAYIRVSTDEQAREGVSLAAQEERLRAFALATGRENLIVIRDEGASAKTLLRPGLTSILEAVRAGTAASVVVLKLDRLTRSVRDLADLLECFAKADTALVSVTESLDTATAGGRLMLNLLASVSQWERETVGERTSFALAHKRRNRGVYGRCPFGYRQEGSFLVAVPGEQAVLQDAIKRRSGGASLRDIARLFTSEGFLPPQGGKAWRASSVKAVLCSKIVLEDVA